MSKKSLTGFDANNKVVSNVADPSAATDAANKQYVDGLIRGLSWKDEVRAATTANGTLATAFANGQTIDGITLATNDRILVKDQSSGQENGIYTVNASGAPTRAVDADATAELENAAVFVALGTVNADRAYVQTATVTTPGTTPQTWVQFGGGGTVTAGNGLTGTTTISVLLDTASGLIVAGSGLKIDPAVVTRKYAADCVVTTNPQTFNHALATADVAVFVKEVSTGLLVEADITITDANNISVNFGGAPTAAQYRVIVKA